MIFSDDEYNELDFTKNEQSYESVNIEQDENNQKIAHQFLKKEIDTTII